MKYFEEYLKEQMRITGCPIVEEIYFDAEEKDKFWVPVYRLDQGKNQNVKAGEI